MQCMESIFHKHIAFLHFLWILCFIICRYLHIFCNCISADMDMTEWEKMHFPWIYFTTKNARELMPPMHHFDGSCQFILHHTLFRWSLRPNFFWNVQTFQFFSPPYFRATCEEKSFYEIPEMPRLQYKNANMSRSVEGKGELSQIIIFLPFCSFLRILKKEHKALNYVLQQKDKVNS